MTDASGNVIGEQRYYLFGETRLTAGTIYTDRLYTGQQEMNGLGVYNYGARFYSPKLGRFLSPDTIVPNPANPQDLNRFSYVRNNPLRYTDPTGHAIPCEQGDVCIHLPPLPPPPPPKTPTPAPTPTPTSPPTYTPPSTFTPGTPPSSFTQNPSTQDPTGSDITQVAEFLAGAVLVVGGLLVTALGAYLVVSGLIETATIVGAFLGLHAIPVGVAMIVIGVGITAAGAILINDSLSTPQSSEGY